MLDTSGIEALIFDLDGTLYRQRPVRLAMLRRLLLAHWSNPIAGVRVFRSLQAYRRAQETLRLEGVNGDLVAAQLAAACAAAREQPETMLRLIDRWMDEEPLSLLAAARFDGVPELLAAARRKPWKLAVLSDYPAERKLRAMGLDGCFDLILSAQDERVQRFKPDPRGLQVAAGLLGVRPDAAVYIGDRPEVDAEAAARAGLRCIIVSAKRLPASDRFLQVDGFPHLARMLSLAPS